MQAQVLEEELEPEFMPPLLPQVGEWVFVAYWSAYPMPDNPKAGSGSITNCRLVSMGPQIAVVEVDNPSIMNRDAVHGSTLRFVPVANVFSDETTARQFAKDLKPPVG